MAIFVVFLWREHHTRSLSGRAMSRHPQTRTSLGAGWHVRFTVNTLFLFLRACGSVHAKGAAFKTRSFLFHSTYGAAETPNRFFCRLAVFPFGVRLKRGVPGLRLWQEGILPLPHRTHHLGTGEPQPRRSSKIERALKG